MRWFRYLLAGSVVAATLLPTTSALAAGTEHIGLHDMTCNGIGVMGTGLPASTRLNLKLADKGDGKTLATQMVTTSATGTFSTTVKARLNQVLGMRVTVSDGQNMTLAFADHQMEPGMAMCTLPFTGGADHAMPLILFGAVLLAVGGGLLAFASHTHAYSRYRAFRARRAVA